MTDPTTPAPLTDNELAAIRTHTRAYLPSTEDAPILVEAATDRRRLLDEVGRLRASLDRAKAAAAWERGQRRSQSSTLGVKIDQLGIARAEHAALAARLADAEQARDEAISVAAANAAERNEYARAAVDAEIQTAAVRDFINGRSSFVRVLRQYSTDDMTDYHRWTGHAEARRVLAKDLGLTLDPETGGLASHEPATATGAPGPDPSEGTAPTSPQEPTQAAVDTIARILVGTDWDEEVPYTDIGPRETVAHLARRIIAAAADLDIGDRLRAERDALAAKLAAVRTIEPTLRRIYSASDGTQAERAETTTAPGGAAPGPAPLTLAQAAGHLHDWARDLTDGTNTSYPHGHPSVIRGIRAAAEWLDARDRYEREARQQAADDYRAAATRAVVDDVMSIRQAATAFDAALAEALAETEEATEPAEPTLRDVVRAMRTAGLRLEKRRIWNHRRLLGQGEERGIVTPGQSGDYDVILCGRDGWCVEMRAPTPAEILTAARLAGLIGDTDA